MTSKQVMLTAAVLSVFLTACGTVDVRQGADALRSPYPTRRVWAVAPLRNESGSQQADGLGFADHLAHELEQASNIDVLPVNRTIEAMGVLNLNEIRSPAEAKELLHTLGCDGLVIGTITAYDPYDPPKLGLAIELYTSDEVEHADVMDPHLLAISTSDTSMPGPRRSTQRQPVSVVSAFLDGGDPSVREQMKRYGVRRHMEPENQDLTTLRLVDRTENWRVYRISMDLFSEFASYVMSWRLLDAETRRLTPTTQPSRER